MLPFGNQAYELFLEFHEGLHVSSCLFDVSPHSDGAREVGMRMLEVESHQFRYRKGLPRLLQ